MPTPRKPDPPPKKRTPPPPPPPKSPLKKATMTWSKTVGPTPKPPKEDEKGWKWGSMGNKRGPSRIVLQNGKKGKRNK
jgi:hypothetical protein